MFVTDALEGVIYLLAALGFDFGMTAIDSCIALCLFRFAKLYIVAAIHNVVLQHVLA